MIRRAEALRSLRNAEATARADTEILASTPASKLAGDPVSAPERRAKKTTADSSAALRNDKKKGAAE
jgi:hypothetical protein